MKTALFAAQNNLCVGCSLALGRLIGVMDGVESIDAEREKADIRFNEAAIDEK